MEFLVHMEVSPIPEGSEAEVELRKREAIRARELADMGILHRLWRVPGKRENWGIWRAKDTDALREALGSLPMFSYLVITVHPLASHPNDPKVVGGLETGLGS
jgi:muconolactone D-isomerase